MPDIIITPDRALRAIQRKLETAELAHLREYIIQQQTKIDDLKADLVTADNNAEYWRESWFEMAGQLADESGSAIGLTVDGQVGLVDQREALIRKIASLNPDAGTIGAGMLASLVADATALVS